MAATKPPLSAAEEEVIIKNRFLTQMSVPRGVLPLKLLTKKFIQLMEVAEKGSAEEVDKVFFDLSRELTQMELSAKRLGAVIDANTREQAHYAQKQHELELAIEQAKQDIEDRKKDLKQAKEIKDQNEQYEVLRHLIMEHPSRAVTQESIDREMRQIHDANTDVAKAAQLMEKRKKQFALLMHVIEDLQKACEDTPEELAAEVLLAASSRPTAAVDAMEVDGRGGS